MKKSVIKKQEIRLFYESNELTAAEVARKYGIAPRTIQHWIVNEHWKRARRLEKLKEELKGRYSLVKAAQSELKETIAGALTDDETRGLIETAAFSESVEANFLKTISASKLNSEFAFALIVVKNQLIAAIKNNSREQTRLAATYADLLQKFKEIAVGKDPLIVVKSEVNFESLSDEDLRNLVSKEDKNDDEI